MTNVRLIREAWLRIARRRMLTDVASIADMNRATAAHQAAVSRAAMAEWTVDPMEPVSGLYFRPIDDGAN